MPARFQAAIFDVDGVLAGPTTQTSCPPPGPTSSSPPSTRSTGRPVRRAAGNEGMTPLGSAPLMAGSLPSGAVAGFQQIMPAEMLAADTAS
jgi:hypothetical protein